MQAHGGLTNAATSRLETMARGNGRQPNGRGQPSALLGVGSGAAASPLQGPRGSSKAPPPLGLLKPEAAYWHSCGAPRRHASPAPFRSRRCLERDLPGSAGGCASLPFSHLLASRAGRAPVRHRLPHPRSGAGRPSILPGPRPKGSETRSLAGAEERGARSRRRLLLPGQDAAAAAAAGGRQPLVRGGSGRWMRGGRPLASYRRRQVKGDVGGLHARRTSSLPACHGLLCCTVRRRRVRVSYKAYGSPPTCPEEPGLQWVWSEGCYSGPAVLSGLLTEDPRRLIF